MAIKLEYINQSEYTLGTFRSGSLVCLQYDFSTCDPLPKITDGGTLKRGWIGIVPHDLVSRKERDNDSSDYVDYFYLSKIRGIGTLKCSRIGKYEVRAFDVLQVNFFFFFF